MKKYSATLKSTLIYDVRGKALRQMHVQIKYKIKMSVWREVRDLARVQMWLVYSEIGHELVSQCIRRDDE